MPVGVGTNVCLTILLFDGLFVHSFVCNYTVLYMFLSVYLSTSSNIVCLCVRPSIGTSVRMYAYFCVILYVNLSVYMFFFVPSSVRSSIRLVVSIYVCM